MMKLDAMPVLLPNLDAELAHAYLNALKLDGIILTGGNTLAHLNPNHPQNAPERDAFEAAAVRWASVSQVPVIGVCRGMQHLNHLFGGKCIPCIDHARCRHLIQPTPESTLKARNVNSYHDYAIYESSLADALKPLAMHADGSIEAIAHLSKPIYGMMWHPERESDFDQADLDCFLEWLK